MTLLELFYNFSHKNSHLSKRNLKKMNIFLKLYCYSLLNRTLSSISKDEVEKVLNNIDNKFNKIKTYAYLNIIFKHGKKNNLVLINIISK